MTIRLFASGLVMFAAVAGWSKWAMPTEMPVDRVLKNTEALLAKKPDDAKAHYVMGRVLSYRYAFPGKTIAVFDGGEFPAWTGLRYVPTESADKRKTADLIGSLEHYSRAVFLNEDDNLARLGLAWMCEQAADLGPKLPAINGVSVAGKSRTWWFTKALAEYRAVYGGSKEQVLKEESVGHGISIPALEAAERISVIITVKKVGKFGLKEEADFLTTKKLIDEKPHWITPIVVPLADGPLVDNGSSVRFDLSGAGLVEQRGWVTPSAGLLCWDPSGRGEITSGRQLFGTGTFWMFYENGFEAMSSLDDNRDGWLSGRELDGLSLWHDSDGDGSSSVREVRPVSEWGIIGLRCTGYGRGSLGLEVGGGVVWRDGRRTPLYDWVVG